MPDVQQQKQLLMLWLLLTTNPDILTDPNDPNKVQADVTQISGLDATTTQKVINAINASPSEFKIVRSDFQGLAAGPAFWPPNLTNPITGQHPTIAELQNTFFQ